MRALSFAAVLALSCSPALAKDVSVPDGEAIPEIRPCIDVMARGELESLGEPEPLDIEDDYIGHEVYTWRFTKREVVFGEMPEASKDLRRADHALVWPQPPRDDVLVLLARKGRGTRYLRPLPVSNDEQGRAFVPILHPDDIYEPLRSGDWRPDALMQFTRPVVEEAGNNVQDDGGPRVIARLYLEDIPALMAASARDEDCWR
jgi:hypothetical protein